MPFFSNDSRDRGAIATMQATFDKALNKDGYKGGAFRGLINASTPPLDVLNMLLGSERVTEQEKNKAFRPWKAALVRFYNTNLAAVDPFQIIMLMMSSTEWCEVFDDDTRSRGGYVPPTLVQSVNSDGTVEETHVLGRDGSAQVTKGGRPGEVPGAPERFNEAQHKTWEDYNQETDAQVIIMVSGRTEQNTGSGTKDEDFSAAVNTAAEAKSPEENGDRADNHGKEASVGNALGKANLEGLDKKGRREAAKAAKKVAKKAGKKANPSK